MMHTNAWSPFSLEFVFSCFESIIKILRLQLMFKRDFAKVWHSIYSRIRFCKQCGQYKIHSHDIRFSLWSMFFFSFCLCSLSLILLHINAWSPYSLEITFSFKVKTNILHLQLMNNRDFAKVWHSIDHRKNILWTQTCKQFGLYKI